MQIINQLFGLFWVFIPLAVLAAILKSPSFKGATGEFVVNFVANIALDKEKYHRIENVTIPTENGSTQIDHVFISQYGIFVVETKNMKGWIFGDSNQKTWTQKIYSHSNKFQNPIHQNYKHVKTLQSLLELNDNQIHSVVVFIGESKFKTEMPENVTQGGGYIRYIKSKTETVFTKSEVDKIVNKIESSRLTPSFKTNREHIRHVNNIVADKSDGESCPKCGDSMILRESKQGQNAGRKFWGCSNFPKCRGIVNIT